MILKGHNALWYANLAILWQTVNRTRSAIVPSDKTLATSL